MMRNLKIKEVSEMVFRYMTDNHINILTAYEHVSNVLQEGNPYSFEDIKAYLFHNDFSDYFDLPKTK